ncbi:MAG: RICIN domain-containing protein [Clostridia bacterium]|nr:RICIN domain-containing protein [Clostridia bacterium]
MKKRFIAALLVAVMTLSVAPLERFAKLDLLSPIDLSINASAASNVDTIYNFLKSEVGLNSAAACGVLANIQYESGFNPTAYNPNDNGGPSYGICQWHDGNGCTNFTKLKDWCTANGYDYTKLDAQLRYLKYSLNKDFKGLLTCLKSVRNNAEGAYCAAYAWCFYYEKPSNKVNKGIDRGNLAKTTYWDKYKSGTIAADYAKVTKGDYKLKNAYNGKYLEVAGGTDANKTNIQVGTVVNSTKQKFNVSAASTGYKMRPLSSSARLVNAWDTHPQNGSNVNIYDNCNELSQWWYFEKVSGGYVIRLAYNSSLVLTLSSSDNVTVTTYSSGNKKQIWSLETGSTAPVTPKPTVTEENLSMNYKSTKELSGFKSITTSNSDVVSVSGSTISAVGTGSADITATRANGDTCIYHVKVSYTWWQWIIVICLFGWTWY